MNRTKENKAKQVLFSLNNLFIVLTFFMAWYFMSAVISPFLHYHFQQIAFLKGADFFKNYMNYPGGISDYAAEFISQFLSFNEIGSLMIVLIISFQGFIVLRITRKLVGETQLKFGIFTLMLIFGVSCFLSYYYPFYISVRLLFSLLFAWIFLIICMKFPKNGQLFYYVLSFILFYIASGASLIVFALSSSLILLILRNQRHPIIHIPLFIILGVLIPYIGYVFIFPVSLRDVYEISIAKPPSFLSYSPGIPVYLTYAFLPFVLLVSFVFSRHFKLKKMEVEKSKLNSLQETPFEIRKSHFFSKNSILIPIQLIACFLLAWFFFSKLYDPFQKKLRLVEYYADNQKWQHVMEIVGKLEKEDVNNSDYFKINFQTARALAHMGQLGERLFEYPQSLGIYGLIIDANYEHSAAITSSDLYFDLGLISESQRWAFEAQTLMPYSPRVLKRLVLINLVNNKYDRAEEFLSVLEKNMMCKQWVKHYKKFISNPELAGNDEEIAERRNFSPPGDFALINDEVSLKILAETNRNNFMAYQYLLSYFLLDLNLDEFIHNLNYFEEYKLDKLPRSWAEALCSYSVNHKKFPDELPKSLEPEAMMYLNSYIAFSKMFMEYSNAKDLEQAAKTRYGETFWYYSEFANPVVSYNKDEIIEIK